MDVIQVTVEIVLITDYVIPEAVLPNSPAVTNRAAPQCDCKAKFDSMHEARDVGVLGIGEDVNVIRENDPGDEFKSNPLLRIVERPPKQFDMVNQQRPPLERDVCYEYRTSQGGIAPEF
jgi:hypothetical protein